MIDPDLVIDIHAPGFREEAKRQSLAVAMSDREEDVMEFIEATCDIDENDVVE
ncbi:MAG TPA: antitoxin MazE-like protein [Skermanella sp.]|nr:antitoxin MazE-like protein [Skermanella sp.]